MNAQNQYQPIDIANWFLHKIDPDAGDAITHLKLQKLVYYAQAWSLALLNKSLFEEDFEAWAHGPVVRSLFQEFRDFGWKPIFPTEEQPHFDSDIEELLDEVYRVYGEHSAKTLEMLTHREAPWAEAREGYEPEERCNEIISKDKIKRYYSKVYEQARRDNQQG